MTNLDIQDTFDDLSHSLSGIATILKSLAQSEDTNPEEALLHLASDIEALSDRCKDASNELAD